MSDDESDEEESSSNDFTDYSEILCFVISKLWIEEEKHINTDYAVTGWVLCVIPHIKKDVLKIQMKNNRNQVNNVIFFFFLAGLRVPMACS